MLLVCSMLVFLLLSLDVLVCSMLVFLLRSLGVDVACLLISLLVDVDGWWEVLWNHAPLTTCFGKI